MNLWLGCRFFHNACWGPQWDVKMEVGVPVGHKYLRLGYITEGHFMSYWDPTLHSEKNQDSNPNLILPGPLHKYSLISN